MNEELGCDVEVGPLLDCRVYEVLPERQVVIITFGMIQRDERELRHSLEHRALRLVCLDELRELALPLGYHRAVHRWVAMHGTWAE